MKEKNIFLKMRRRVEKAKKSEAKAKGILEKAKRIFEKSYLTIYTRGHVIVHNDIQCISLWTITEAWCRREEAGCGGEEAIIEVELEVGKPKNYHKEGEVSNSVETQEKELAAGQLTVEEKKLVAEESNL